MPKLNPTEQALKVQKTLEQSGTPCQVAQLAAKLVFARIERNNENHKTSNQ